ncbi:MAG: F0F1 ATP synthase subunit epsilon [Desulfobulbaceae bacterium]|uniref:F0F1 ATP synthase subunit epsilon n=1 Tax=Candidatus Desulfobia pelagia TaxID=2841692 RepID=A0A8J6NBE4_9BACT|nr:F0F1 ATP synthase subunit epsilon [Candidatus Desulfobia pelagia]
MTLKILLPTSKFLDEKVEKVKGEGLEGEFCLKPRHIDYATALLPGIFSYVSHTGKEQYIALDQGILVKQGHKVVMITRRAIAGELGQLNTEVEKMLMERDEREKQNRSAVAMLEIGFIKRFLEFSHR